MAESSKQVPVEIPDTDASSSEEEVQDDQSHEVQSSELQQGDVLVIPQSGYGPDKLCYLYIAEFKVVVCSKCHKGLTGWKDHIVSHGVVAQDSADLRYAISTMDVLNAKDVVKPTSIRSPIPGIATVDGWGCSVSGCSYVNIVTGRSGAAPLNQHLVSHGPEAHATRRKAIIQTIFKQGSYTHYFEVTMHNDPVSDFQVLAVSNPYVYIDPPAAVPRPFGPRSKKSKKAVTTTPAVTESSIAKIGSKARIPGMHHSFDLKIIGYTAQALQSTHFYLPVAKSLSPTYWQGYVGRRMRYSQWIVSGMLSLAAYELLSNTPENDNDWKKHAEAASQYANHFIYDPRQDSVSPDAGQRMMGLQIACFLHCCYWTLSSEGVRVKIGSALEHLKELVEKLTDSVAAETNPDLVTLHKPGSLEAGLLYEPNLQRLFGHGTSTAPPKLLARLDVITTEIFEMLGEDYDDETISIILNTVTELKHCVRQSFSSPSIHEIWDAMKTFFANLEQAFKTMLFREKPDPAALIVLYYAIVLVERVEENCWFLGGLAEELTRTINERLPGMGSLLRRE